MNKLNLLIVDDEINTQETLRDIFEAQGGFSVFTADNGKKAVELARERFFNIILMDVKMPGMNGVEAFKKIKKISVSTEVIMMTGYSVDDLLQEAVREGVYAVMYKPIRTLLIF